MSYANTVYNALRTRYPNNYDKNERRLSQYGALEIFEKQNTDPNSFINAEARALIEDSFGSSAEVNHPVLNATTATIGTSITCAMPDANDGNSDLVVTATPTTYAFGFTMVKDQHIKNEIGYEAALQEKLVRYELQLLEEMDIDAVSVIESAINAYFPAEILAYYSQTANALQVAQANKDDFYNNLSAILAEMDFAGGSDILANRIHEPMVNRFINQGAGNSENQQFQFGGYQYFYDNTRRIANNAGVESTVYAIKSGSLAMIDRIPTAYKEGALIGGDRNPVKEKTTMRLPLTGIEIGVLYQQDCSDQSALGIGEANTASFVEGWSFFLQRYFLTVYNSDTVNRYTPILKAEILA